MTPLLTRKRLVAGTLGVMVLGLILASARQRHVAEAPPDPLPEVEVAQVEQKYVPIFGEWISTLDGFTNADFRAQVTGYLLRQDPRTASRRTEEGVVPPSRSDVVHSTPCRHLAIPTHLRFSILLTNERLSWRSTCRWSSTLRPDEADEGHR